MEWLHWLLAAWVVAPFSNPPNGNSEWKSYAGTKVPRFLTFTYEMKKNLGTLAGTNPASILLLCRHFRQAGETQ